MTPRLVLFDCDGTLVDSAGSIHQCMARTFEDFSLVAPSDAATRRIIGLSLDLAIAGLLDCAVDERVMKMTARYKENFIAHRAEDRFDEPFFPGIAALLEHLHKDEATILGMVTGKSRRGVRAVCERHGLDCFHVVRTADDCPSKPHPAMVLECCAEAGIAPQDTFVIGDTVYDVTMAREAGARAIAVDWGYHERTALFEAGAEHILSTPEDLLSLI